jgi:hypothetical protein
MGTYCAPLLLYSYKAQLIQKVLHEKNKLLAVAFSSIFRYIDDALSINDEQFHSSVDSIYPSELEIKEITQSTSALYLNILMRIDAGSKLTTLLYDK